jgi:uncharacterized repeat protein (TIGR01451 family)
VSRVTRGLGPLLAALLVLGAIQAATANAAPASPHWSIASEAQPSYFHAGDTADAYVLIVRNDGAAPTTRDSAVTITDELPTGVTAAGCPDTNSLARGCRPRVSSPASTKKPQRTAACLRVRRS